MTKLISFEGETEIFDNENNNVKVTQYKIVFCKL